MRYLGIDWGEKRIGLAVSDEDARIAFPRAVVSSLGEVAEYALQETVGAIVIGLPSLANGGDSQTARRVRAFAEDLGSKVKLPIVFENELYSTQIAEQTSSREHADAAAAALILQSYLDKQISKISE